MEGFKSSRGKQSQTGMIIDYFKSLDATDCDHAIPSETLAVLFSKEVVVYHLQRLIKENYLIQSGKVLWLDAEKWDRDIKKALFQYYLILLAPMVIWIILSLWMHFL